MKPSDRPRYDARAAGADCDRCPLKNKRPVGPSGPLDADLVIVGEAPGSQEEKRGEPFVGPSGDLLNMMFAEIGIDRKRVYLTNAALCRSETPGVEGRRRYDVKTYLAFLRSENARLKKLAKKNKVEFFPVPSPFACCRPRLLRELQHFEQVALDRGQPNGAVIIPTGNFALFAVTGKAGILKYRGSPMRVDPKTLTYLPPGPPALEP